MKKTLIKISLFTFGTLIMFYALFFNNKVTSWTTIEENSKNPMMYLCLVLSFIHYYILDKIIKKTSKRRAKKQQEE
jgi:hypothetical protein